MFSSWTKTFDIIQPQLWANSIRCVRLDGSLSASGRASVLRVFRTNPGIKVLLATISCGGVGLDLTAASRAYIMEPQWNPMSESQALDRIYRLGQQNEVKTIRYIMKGSWEEQVVKLQRRKQELADLTLNNGEISKADLTYGRLQYLKELVGWNQFDKSPRALDTLRSISILTSIDPDNPIIQIGNSPHWLKYPFEILWWPTFNLVLWQPHNALLANHSINDQFIFLHCRGFLQHSIKEAC